MHIETVTGLLSVKPGNEPEQGETRTFVVEQRTGKSGKPYLKIKSAGPDYGGTPYRIISAEPTGFVDAHKNISFSVEIEPVNGGDALRESQTQSRDITSNAAPTSEPESAAANGSKIESYGKHARHIFTVAWNEATEAMTLIPKKDDEELSVAEWLDLKLRMAQGFTIEINKIIRKERF